MSKEKKFFEAADYGSIEEFNSLLKQVDVNCKNEIGQTALHIVATYGNLLKSISLLGRGAIPAIKDNDGYTPLATAVSHMLSEARALSDYTEVIELLVAAGDSAKSLDILYTECDDGTDESLETIESVNKIVKFINLISEGVDKGIASAIVTDQAQHGPIVDSDDTSNESITAVIVDNKAPQGLKHSRSDSECSSNEIEPSHKSTKHSHDDNGSADTNEANHHSDSISYNKDDDSSKAEQTNHEEFSETNLSLSELTLKNFYAWIQELPERLQHQILSSSPVKSMIESAKQIAAIYDIKSAIQDLFTTMTSPKFSNGSIDMAECILDDKVQILDLRPVDSIDMTMVLKNTIISGWILPTGAMGSDNFFVDHAFGGAAMNLNGLNAIDVF